MICDPTCLFCKGKLGLGQPLYDTKDFRTVSETSTCRKCNVTQTFAVTGQPLSYSFKVGPYYLDFDLKQIKFTIRQDVFSNIVATINYIPKNLTPQNTTLERIKLFILFS